MTNGDDMTTPSDALPIIEQITAADLDLEPLTCQGEDYIWRPAKKARVALAAAREEIKRLAASPSPWRDMESAPKDGTPILSWDEDDKQCAVVAWDTRERDWVLLEGDNLPYPNAETVWACTHWQPLPSPPSDGGGK